MNTPEIDHAAYEKLRKEHELLHTRLEQARAMLLERSLDVHEALALLGDLRAHMKEHFAGEEAGGYFTEVVERAPWLAERTEALHRQHPEMLKAMDGIMHTARESDNTPGWWKHIGEQYTALYEKITAHEKNEDDLVQQAFTEDIGDKD